MTLRDRLAKLLRRPASAPAVGSTADDRRQAEQARAMARRGGPVEPPGLG